MAKNDCKPATTDRPGITNRDPSVEHVAQRRVVENQAGQLVDLIPGREGMTPPRGERSDTKGSKSARGSGIGKRENRRDA